MAIDSASDGQSQYFLFPRQPLQAAAAATSAGNEVLVISDDDDAQAVQVSVPQPNDVLAELRPLLLLGSAAWASSHWHFRVDGTQCDCDIQTGGLVVTEVRLNSYVLPGSPMLARFAAALSRAAERRVVLAFHGTHRENLEPICAHGLDPLRRRGQSFGVGEYFTTWAPTALAYCHGTGRTVLLFALLLDPAGLTVHNGNVIVVHASDNQLPLGTVTFA